MAVLNARKGSQSVRAFTGSAVLAVLAVAVGFSLLVATPQVIRDAMSFRYLIVGAILVALTLPLLTFIARGDRSLERVMLGGLLLKLASAFLRLYVAFEVYGGSADASSYDDSGRLVARELAQGHLNPADMDSIRGGEGTEHFAYVVGWVYHIFGADLGVGFLVMSWLGFLGLLMFFKAGQVGIPEGDHRLLAKLLFFMPSLLFWPSSIGKESWMLFALGMAALGAAYLVGPKMRLVGLIPAAVGTLAAGWIRPHMALLFACALSAGVVLRRSRGTPSVGRQLVVGGLAVLIVLSMGSKTQAVFGVSALSSDGSTSLTDVALAQTAQGGSEFEAKPVTNPIQLPMAFLSVAVRPFPFESHSIVQLLSSLEGVFLLAIFYKRRPALRSIASNAMAVTATIYSIGFVVAFSNIANFGILARQRVQLLPFLLFLLILQRGKPLDGKLNVASVSVASNRLPRTGR